MSLVSNHPWRALTINSEYKMLVSTKIYVTFLHSAASLTAEWSDYAHYELCVLIYKCLHPAAPTYIDELCSPVSESANHGHLRSAARGDLAVPRSRTTRYCQRCFAVSGPTLWNSLPLSICDLSLTLTQFCVPLKTVLFCTAYETLAIAPTWQFRL